MEAAAAVVASAVLVLQGGGTLRLIEVAIAAAVMEACQRSWPAQPIVAPRALMIEGGGGERG